jgi:1-aminocyclopropane-1-carboxylate deaminase/D-cysteine desulfhydrase-like pyridoxal-dependent ACC family enzyme
MDFQKILYEETPVEKHGNLFFKRDDLFEFAGMRGAKVRAALYLCLKAKEAGYSSVVSACSRYSPQLVILGAVCKELGLSVTGFVAEGRDTPFVRRAIDLGVDVRRVKPGYSTVARYRAVDYAGKQGAFLVSFGMHTPQSIDLTTHQAELLFSGDMGKWDRVIVVAGSGVNMSGVLHGLAKCKVDTPVLGVLVGYDCTAFVLEDQEDYAGKVSFVRSPISYDKEAIYSHVNGVELDSRYEGKAVPYLCPGDLFWLVGFAGSNTVPVERFV